MKESELLGSAQANLKAVEYLATELKLNITEFVEHKKDNRIQRKSQQIFAAFDKELERMSDLLEQLLCENI